MTPGNSERLSDCFAGCDPSTLARDFGTPLLVIDEMCLRSRMRRFVSAFAAGRPSPPSLSAGPGATVTYAGKALLLKAVAQIARDEGLLIDVCSLGELETAVRAGVAPDHIIVHGCYKTDEELKAAVDHHVRLLVVDHFDEIARLGRYARAAAVPVDVLLRLNPAITADTHALVQTSAPSSKFGFSIADGQARAAAAAIVREGGLRLAGLHCHLGSSLYALDIYADAVDALSAFARACADIATFDIFDLGGGLGAGQRDAHQEPTPEAWAAVLSAALDRNFAGQAARRPQLFVEPGRSLVAAAGTTLYRIGVRKRLADGRDALIVDGGLSDNPRPALYDARYQVFVADRPDAEPSGTFTVFGRHCETDRLFPDVALADPKPGELLAVRDTGAYTYAMASNYNRFPRPAVVLARDGTATLAARRETLDRVLELDVDAAP